MPIEKHTSFSMSDIKTINSNWLQLQLFFNKFGITPYSTQNRRKARERINYGTFAA